MPGVYKLKACPQCLTEHRKKGKFCSQACSNSYREPTENQREAMRQVATEFNRTPQALARQSLINTPLASLTVEDFAVEIPTIYDLPEGYETDW